MTNARILIPLALVIGVVAVAFFMYDRDDSQDVVVDDIAESRPDPEESNRSKAEIGADDNKPESGSELPDGLAALAREEVGGDDKRDRRRLVLQVWERKEGTPAVKAEVFYLAGYRGPELRDPFADHWSELAVTRGRKFETDAAGRVQLPAVTKSHAIVAARTAGSFGFHWLGRRHKEIETIVLQSDETVTVRVVDGQGRGVSGVPVGVVQHVPERDDPMEGFTKVMSQMRDLDQHALDLQRRIASNDENRQMYTVRLQQLRDRQEQLKRSVVTMKKRLEGMAKAGKWKKGMKKPPVTITSRPELRARRRTGKDGVAVFRHFQVRRRGARKWWPPAHHNRFRAVLLLPAQQSVAHEFHGHPVSGDVIELQLPPTGSIVMRTVDRDGRPYAHPVNATLRIEPSGKNRPVPWSRVQLRKEQDQTELVFPFVGLGLRFVVHCRLDDNDFRWNVPAVVGPTSAGQRCVMDLVVAPKAGMLYGRLLDEQGRPLAGQRPSFLVNASTGRLEGEDVTTDRSGRFHLPYHVRDAQRPPYRLEIRRKNVYPTAGLTKALASLPMARVTDLGDLKLGVFGRIADGIVRDDRGHPIAGASVHLQRRRDVGGKQQRWRFVDEAFVVGRTNEKGAYQVFGELDPVGRYRLSVRARGHFSLDANDEPRDMRKGKQPDFVLMRRSRCVGTVLAPAWLKAREIGVVLESVEDAKQTRSDRVHDHRGKRYIYFDWVRPGAYNVVVRLANFPDPVLRVDGVRIQPGETGLHPRLNDLDLRSLVHRFVLSAVNDQGRPMKPDAPLVARLARLNGRPHVTGFKWRGNRVEIVSVARQIEVWPVSTGYRAESVVLPAGEHTVRFLRIPPVDVVVPGMSRLVGSSSVWLRLHLEQGVGGPNQLDGWDGRSKQMAGLHAKVTSGGHARLRKDDTARIRLTRDGRYRGFAYLTGGGRKLRVELGAVDIRLTPGSGPQRVTLSYDRERLLQKLAELGRPRENTGSKRR